MNSSTGRPNWESKAHALHKIQRRTQEEEHRLSHMPWLAFSALLLISLAVVFVIFLVRSFASPSSSSSNNHHARPAVSQAHRTHGHLDRAPRGHPSNVPAPLNNTATSPDPTK